MTPKRKSQQSSEHTHERVGTGVRRKTVDTDAFTTKSALQEMLESAKAQTAAINAEIAEAERAQAELKEAKTRVHTLSPSRRTISKRTRKRIYTDGVDDFELALAKHGISFEDLMKAARSLEMGTHTPYARLAAAVLLWWCSKPMAARRVVWVDPDTGYTSRTLPKFSTAEGQDLITRGLAGASWVSTRKQLLDARAWAKRMMSLTPAQRLSEPIQLGDERLTKHK